MKKYPHLDIVEFGRTLITTGDLDPVYIALNNSGWSEAQRLRWLVAYVAFYHCGVACLISERKRGEFWFLMAGAADNQEMASPCADGRWPRGKERRHFRAEAAVKAVEEWEAAYPEPEEMFRYIAGKNGNFDDIMVRALRHRSVGSWMSFKMVDLVDACMGVDVDQSDVWPFLYETPRTSLLQQYRKRHRLKPSQEVPDEQKALMESINYLRKEFSDLTIPHKPGKPIDMFCIETVACKHLSHLHGHYPIGNDITEIRHGLQPWLECKSAQQFLKAVPSGEKL